MDLGIPCVISFQLLKILKLQKTRRLQRPLVSQDQYLGFCGTQGVRRVPPMRTGNVGKADISPTPAPEDQAGSRLGSSDLQMTSLPLYWR